jgi:uncharacterized protein YoxC
MKRARLTDSGLGAVCAGLALALLAGGCERSDPGSVAVNKSSVGLHSISGGNVSKAPDAYIASEMPKVSTEAAKAIEGDSGTKAAGSMIGAQANLSLAELALSNVVELERQSAEKRLEIRRHASVWTDRGASAAVAGAFNPSEVIAKLQAEKTAKQSEIAALQTAKAQLDARLTQLRAQAKAKLDQASSGLADYEAKRGDIAKLSATDAARVLESTQSIKKQSDLMRLEGERILAQVSVLEPDATAKGLEIQQRQNQIASVDTAIVELNTRASLAQADASAARADQQKAGEAIAAGATELRDFREGKLKDAIDSARKTINAAITTIKGAASDPSAGGKLVLARAQQTLGDLSFTHAQTLSQYGQLMSHLATVSPALAEASRYADDAKKSQDDAKEAIEAATKAYEAAQSAYESTPVKGEVKERLKKVGENLGKVAAMAAGVGADAGAALPEDIKAFAGTLIAAAKAGDSGAMLSAVHASTPEMTQVIGALTEGMKPAKRLSDACKAKFGQTLEEAAQGMGGGMKMQIGPSEDGFKNAELDSLTAKIDGDKATLMDGDKKLADLIKVDGAWKIDAPELAAMVPQVQAMLPMLSAMSSQMDAVATDVEAGKFTSIQEVLGEIAKRMGAPAGMGGAPSGGDMNK